MARFECTSHPSLLVVGAGQFVDGQLEVNGPAAEIVRKIAAAGTFTITEVEEHPAGSNDAGPQDDPSTPNGVELFNPSEHNTEAVLAYLANLDDEDPDARDAEHNRVVEAEKAGKARKGILEAIEGTPAED